MVNLASRKRINDRQCLQKGVAGVKASIARPN